MCPCKRSVTTISPRDNRLTPLRRRRPAKRSNVLCQPGPINCRATGNRDSCPNSSVRLLTCRRRRRRLRVTPSNQSRTSTPSRSSGREKARSWSVRARQSTGIRAGRGRVSSPSAKAASGTTSARRPSCSRQTRALGWSRTRTVTPPCPSITFLVVVSPRASLIETVCGIWRTLWFGRSRMTRSLNAWRSGQRSPKLPPPCNKATPSLPNAARTLRPSYVASSATETTSQPSSSSKLRSPAQIAVSPTLLWCGKSSSATLVALGNACLRAVRKRVWRALINAASGFVDRAAPVSLIGPPACPAASRLRHQANVPLNRGRDTRHGVPHEAP